MLKITGIVKKIGRRNLHEMACDICGNIMWIQNSLISGTHQCSKCFNRGGIKKILSDRTSLGNTPDSCHIWTSYLNKDGYGALQYQGKKYRAARVALELKLGRKIKPGFETCHSCNNRKCVNPDHLYEGTHKKNAEDMALAGSCRGDKVVRSITVDQAKVIKKLLSEGERLIDISRKMKIPVTIIDNIKRDNSWAWLKI